jgi:hypothetical protein
MEVCGHGLYCSTAPLFGEAKKNRANSHLDSGYSGQDSKWAYPTLSRKHCRLIEFML